jgi:hypothetical protein
MFIALVILLSLAVLPRAPAQGVEPAGLPPRFLRLPDVTLSAEDPLYLTPPPVAGWSLAPIGQPALDRLTLSPVEAPFPILPSRGPPSRPSLAVSGLPMAPAPPALSQAPTPSPTGPVAPPAGVAAAEYGAEFRHVPGESSRAELELERGLGSWTLYGDGAGMLTAASPSFARLELQARRQVQPRLWNLRGSGTTVFTPDALVAGGTGAKGSLLLDGERIRFRADTNAQYEYWPEIAAMAGRVSQELAVEPRGPGWAIYGSAQASLLSGLGGALIQPDGLARLGVAWKGERVPLELSAGGGLLYFEDSLAGYPEAKVEYRPVSVLRIQAWLGPFLEAPISLLFRAVNDPQDKIGLHDQGGVAARLGLLLDLPRTGGAAIFVRAGDGFRYRLAYGTLRWERSRELELDLDSTWTLLAGSASRPQIALQLSGSAVMPQPVPEQLLAHLVRSSLDGGVRFGFARIPLELLIKAHWGDFPLESEQALLAGSLNLFSGWMTSALVRWSPDPRLTWFAGAEVRQPAEVRVVLGCAMYTRSERTRGLARDSAR